MALIKCIECGKDVSENDAICPNCGNPISEKKNEKSVVITNFLLSPPLATGGPTEFNCLEGELFWSLVWGVGVAGLVHQSYVFRTNGKGEITLLYRECPQERSISGADGGF